MKKRSRRDARPPRPDERDPRPPAMHTRFGKRYPTLMEAWELVYQAGTEGPLDERTRRLVKLGITLGAMREGATHSAVRRGLAEGLTRAEIEQVIALAASTLGFPATVAVYSWVEDLLEGTRLTRATGASP